MHVRVYHIWLYVYNYMCACANDSSCFSPAKKKGGQNGIISAITMCPTAPKLYALGSYSCSSKYTQHTKKIAIFTSCFCFKVGLYSENVKECLMLVSQVKSGVTHMLFSSDGQTLYAGFRMVK